jgi:hypothetical protein
MVSATTKLEKLAVNRSPPLSRRQWNGWGQFRRRRHAICRSLCEADDPRVLAPVRAVQLLLGHTKLESTVRYLGIEVEDALELAEQTEA